MLDCTRAYYYPITTAPWERIEGKQDTLSQLVDLGGGGGWGWLADWAAWYGLTGWSLAGKGS